jgi:hypothetical protein
LSRHHIILLYKVELAEYYYSDYNSTITQATQNLCPISTKFIGVARRPVTIVLTSKMVSQARSNAKASLLINAELAQTATIGGK